MGTIPFRNSSDRASCPLKASGIRGPGGLADVKSDKKVLIQAKVSQQHTFSFDLPPARCGKLAKNSLTSELDACFCPVSLSHELLQIC